jgi:acetolactate decarboxylase
MFIPISKSLQNVLENMSEKTGEPISHLILSALAQYFDVPQHTLFQVSTSGALVQGVYDRAVSSSLLLNYGDFGLGTFENLDGEMIVLDGAIYQVRSDGRVSKITDNVGTPFAMVTHFIADHDQTIESASSFDEIKKICDRYRDSDNLFYALRIDGRFSHIHVRAMRATPDGVPLVKAAA